MSSSAWVMMGEVRVVGFRISGWVLGNWDVPCLKDGVDPRINAFTSVQFDLLVRSSCATESTTHFHSM